MYQEKIFVNSNDVDDHYDLKISTIFKYLQQAATNHSEILGVGKKDTVDKGMFWVITRMRVVIYKMPKMLDTLTVTTHPGETMLFIFPRLYEIYDQHGDLCIAGSATWVLLDSLTHKVKMKPFEDGFKIPGEVKENDIALPDKVTFESIDKIDERRVRYSDIDLNGHLNNTKYIEYIIDTHDINFYKTKRVQEITINYEREIRQNDLVTLFSDSHSPEVVVGKVDNNISFIARLTYINREN